MCLPEQWGDALLYLSGYAPEVFDAVMDTIDPCGQDADPEEDGGMVPFCEACGANVGIFLRRGPDWKHWRVVRGAVPPRPGAEAGQVSDDWDSRGPFEVFEPGHAPLLAWRPAGRPAGRLAGWGQSGRTQSGNEMVALDNSKRRVSGPAATQREAVAAER